MDEFPNAVWRVQSFFLENNINKALRAFFDANPLLHKLIGLTVCNQIVQNAMRVALILYALREGASSATVGILMGCFAFLPMFFSVAIGRRIDRDPYLPLLAGSCGVLLSVFLTLALPYLPVLFVSALICGLSFSTFSIAVQHITGELGIATDRARNYSLLAVGNASAVFAGPLLAGFVIDHLGFKALFALLMIFPVLPIYVFYTRKLILPSPRRDLPPRSGETVVTLLKIRPLRHLLLINLLISTGWDIHAILVPIYGHSIDLSASQIGIILSAFGIATFVVRAVMPFIMHHLSETQILRMALIASGAAYLVFPFLKSALLLAMVSFVLGFFLGSGQPMVLALLHGNAPPRRTGEAAGLRLSMLQMASVIMPVAFSSLGAAIGFVPVLWAASLAMFAGQHLAKPSLNPALPAIEKPPPSEKT
jgi:Arabinose efflux permease